MAHQTLADLVEALFSAELNSVKENNIKRDARRAAIFSVFWRLARSKRWNQIKKFKLISFLFLSLNGCRRNAKGKMTIRTI